MPAPLPTWPKNNSYLSGMENKCPVHTEHLLKCAFLENRASGMQLPTLDSINYYVPSPVLGAYKFRYLALSHLLIRCEVVYQTCYPLETQGLAHRMAKLLSGGARMGEDSVLSQLHLN